MSRRRVRIAATLLAVLLAVPQLSAQVRNWPAERPPRPLPAREVKFPPYATRTLPNGLQVIAVPHHEQPAISVRLIVRAGAAQDPADKPGVAALVATLLDQGTKTRSAEQIASTIDSIGGAMGTGAGTDLTFVNAVMMRNFFPRVLELVSDVARNPAFAADEIERQRQQALSGLQVSYQDPDYIARMVFDRLVYGFHPYGRPSAGTPGSIASITRDDLMAFHGRWFGANNAILAIVGDIKPDEAFDAAARVFGDWARSERAEDPPVEPPPPTRRMVVIDRPGAVQTEIRVGHIALPRRHPDYLALNLATKILGGEGGNRLHRVLRSERGLTYGASAEIHALKQAGDLMADTDTRTETTAETLRLLVDEMWRLQRQRVSQRELADAQAYLAGSFPLTIETPSAIATQILNAVFYGLDLEELQTFRERVNAVTVDDIQRVARQYLRPDRLSIVLVGDASVFEKDLAGAGFDQFERIPLSELDLAAVDLRRRGTVGIGRPPAAALEVAPAYALVAYRAFRDDDSAAASLVARAVRAKGGLHRLRSVRTVRAESLVTIEAPGRPAEVPTRTYIRYPGAFRIDADLPAGRVVQVFNAGQFWIADERGVRAAPQPVADAMRGSIQRDAITLLLGLADGRVRSTLAEVEFQGRAMPALRIAGGEGSLFTAIFDPDTALLVGQRYTTETGAPAEEAFQDYRDVRGLQVAFTATVRREGEPVVRRQLRSFEYNVPLDATLFSRPG